MNNNYNIMILVFVIVFLTLSLYKKYVKKNPRLKNETKSDKPSYSKNISSSKDDEYEPYSKK